MNSDHRYCLRQFGAASAGSAEDLAALHTALLGHSPVALLGPRFMQDFYYSELPRMGLISGAIAYVDTRPAGFVVVTDDNSGFKQRALRRRFFKVAMVMAISVIKDPTRLGAIWEAFQIMRNLPPATSGAPAVGEILSFGVLPEYRTREFMAEMRLRISQDLLKSAMTQLADQGFSQVRVIVDADNLEARLFYLGNGWKPGLGVVPGWRKKTVEFLWQPPTVE